MYSINHIAKVITEDPDVYDDESSQYVLADDATNMLISLADNLRTSPVDLLRKFRIAGFYEDNIEQNEYIGNKPPGQLDKNPDNESEIYLDGELISIDGEMTPDIEDVLSDYWNEIFMAFNTYSYKYALEGPHSATLDFYIIPKDPDPKNDNPVGHAIDKTLQSA